MFNVVTRQGSNTFHGSAWYNKTSSDLQSNNVDAALEAQGVEKGERLDTRHSYSADLGGRLIRDKLWFYSAWRKQKEAQDVLDAFKPDGSPAQSIHNANFFTEKITYQMTPANRMVGFYALSQKHNISGASRFVPGESRTVQMNNQDLAKGESVGVLAALEHLCDADDDGSARHGTCLRTNSPARSSAARPSGIRSERPWKPWII